MKRVVLVAFLLCAFTFIKAGTFDTGKLYHPDANADADIQTAIHQAKLEGKHVFIQAGGNWCIWCLRFNRFVTGDPQLDSLLKVNYVVYHLNYSKENKNNSILRKYGFPQRFGFPVFIILDSDGNHIHTQKSSYLEEASSYNKKMVLEFLGDWTPAKLNPANYKE